MRKLNDVQDILALSDLNEDTLLGLLDAATQSHPDHKAIDELLDNNEVLQARLEELEEDYLNEQIAITDTRKELSRLEIDYGQALRERSFLRSKLAETDAEAAYSFSDEGAPPNPLGECPATWSDIINHKTLAFNRIVITGSERKIKDLANIDADGSALNAAWEALGTLASYRIASLANDWNRDVHDYCESAPADHFHVPPNKHSRGERGATKQDNRFKKARLLPVPRDVDENQAVHMWAHFKPYSWTAERKLRIHYYDQVAVDESIYVGHIGEHLPSASTTKAHR